MIRDNKPYFEGENRCPASWRDPDQRYSKESSAFLSGLRHAADWGLEFEYTEWYIKFRLEGYNATKSKYMALTEWDI